MATLTVHEFRTTKMEQQILATIKVGNFQQGHAEYTNAVLVGWAADGFRSTGCIDLKCDGFVPINYAPITPGDSLEGQSKISIKIFKKKDDGDWWLYFARDDQHFSPVGFWPKSIFNNSLADHANKVTWGGYTGSYSGDASPPMGNGQWPGHNSAAFQDVQYVSGDGQGYAPPRLAQWRLF
ncbi:hypothetical protein BS78_10G205700 [Paspalum vaginatum]|nr:hypothetical protein BS78_10G205700 [Paspalum vaginatum]